ncbi:MAG: NAD(P)H-binding protein [Actinomycetota bacterium]
MILVTGATGKVGSDLVSRLVGAGEEVRVFVRDSTKAAMFDGKVDIAK